MKNNGNQRDNGKENELVIGGYSFETQEEYEKALEEKKSIENLMKKVNLEKKELLVALYSGLVTQNKLSTVIGLEYLCRLRDVIVNKKYAKASELPPIQTGTFKTEKAVGYRLSDTQQKLDEQKKEALKKFKRKFEKTGIVKELRSRQQFDKPSVTKRLKKERAVYVQQLQQVED